MTIPVRRNIKCTDLMWSDWGKYFSRVTTQRRALSMADTKSSLYARLGGYDAIAAVVDDLQVRLESDGTP